MGWEVASPSHSEAIELANRKLDHFLWYAEFNTAVEDGDIA